MTSEVIVMNSLAVALATDSNASIQTDKGTKLYRADKLFMLSKYEPVGIMVHNNGSLHGIPWHTIIKMYRARLGRRAFGSLEDYGLDFIEYLEDSATGLFPDEVQRKDYIEALRQLYRRINSTILERIDEEVEEGGKPDPEALAAQVIQEFYDEWAAEPEAKCFPQDLSRELTGRWSPQISELGFRSFPGLPLPDVLMERLRDLAQFVICKDRILMETKTGIVIAGFGREQHYPVAQTFEFGEIYSGKLKYRHTGKEAITHTNRVVVRPFAHSDMSDSFLRGISPAFEVRMTEELVQLATELPEIIVDAVPRLSAQTRERLKAKFQPLSAEAVEKIVRRLEEYRVDSHRAPIYSAIENLPKDELAQAAAWLVNLNSQQSRMSMEPETVGGPIDVAVISKGDGFIWIDRKHYFKPELNQHFFRNYDKSSEAGESHGAKGKEDSGKEKVTKGTKRRARRRANVRRRGN